MNYRVLNFVIIGLVLLVMIYSCNTDASEVQKESNPVENELVELPSGEEELKEESSFKVAYRRDSLATKVAVDSFLTRYSPEDKEIIFALNRMDAWRLGAGDRLLIPDSLTGNLMDYSPFPEKLDLLDSIPKTILINQRIQGFALYEGEQLILWGPVSSGKASTPTPNGLFYGNFKARNKVSTVNPDWLMPYYFNFMNFEGVGVHQYSMPGYPASHACVRLREKDARFIYNWAEQWKLSPNEQVIERNGTPFMVFGNYEFENTEPWLKLADDPSDNFLKSVELDTLRRYVDRYKKDERNFPEVDSTKISIELPMSRELETIE